MIVISTFRPLEVSLVSYRCVLEFAPSLTKTEKLITADMLQTVWNELDYRVDVCRITTGTHIEHL